MVVLDGLELPVAAAEADRLSRLAPKLRGRVPLSVMALPDKDAALLGQLRERGALFDLRVSTDSVPTRQFCDYLYTRITRWRTGKPPDRWPWREVIARGEASTGYLQGIVTENYHYVRAAAVRQSPLLSHAASAVQFDLVREFVTGEANHERYFLAVLMRWGIPAAEFRHHVVMELRATVARYPADPAP